MHSGHMFSALGLASWVVLGVSGCEDADHVEYGKAPLSESHDHDHGAHEGKHGGHVLELDDAHGHHAELLFDEATRDITLYFYGSEIGVAKAASGLIFEIEQDGKEVVLESKAAPLDGETAESCSRYTITGAGLPESVKSEEQLEGHFHVTIGDKEFVGELHAHSHDEHAAEGHAHDADHKEGVHPDHKDGDAPAADAPASDAPAGDAAKEKPPVR